MPLEKQSSPPHLAIHGVFIRNGQKNTSFDGMNDTEKKKIEEKMLWLGIAPAEPLANKKAVEAVNIYSGADHITGPMGWKFNIQQKNLPPEEQIYNGSSAVFS